MKKNILYLFIAVLSLNVFVKAQVNMSIIVQKPTPTSLSSWQSLPNVVQVIVSNTTMNPYPTCIISIKIKDQNGNILARTKDWDWNNMPKFSIPPAPGTLLLNASQLINSNVIQVDSKIQTAVTTTNSLPEGDYQLCMSIIDNFGNHILNGDEKCSDVSIILPEPPKLIMPEDKQLLTNKLPQFFWSSASLPPQYIAVGYRLKIVKLFSGQSATNGMNTNPAILDKIVPSSSYQYMPSDFNLDTYADENGYAWQVQVYNTATNQPITGIGNGGKSEIWKFLPPVADPTTLKLITPLDNADVSPVNGVYKFTWDASKQKKSKSGFILKVVEVKQGQTPEAAMKINQPVFNKTDILPSWSNYTIAEDQSVFFDNVKYAWQVWTVSQSWGGVIDESEIRSFTVKSSFIETLTAETPINNTVYPSDTGKYAGYNFKWNRNNVKKSISNYKLIIAPVDSGQTAAQGIKLHNSIFETNLGEAITNYKIFQDQGVLENSKKYAWIVIATSKWYNNKIVAKTEPQLFSVSGAATLADNTGAFFVGKYVVQIKTVTNKNIDKFTGSGTVELWNGGPAINLSFNNLKIKQIDTLSGKYWKVIDGDIWSNVNVPDISLPIGVGKNSSLSVKLKIDAVRLNPGYSGVHGVFKLNTPFMKNENNATSNLVIESWGSFMKIDPFTKITSDTISLSKTLPEYKLIQPQNYVLYVASSSNFLCKNNIVDFHMNGAITLPDKFKDREGKKIEFKFKSAPGFKFDHDNTGQTAYYKLTKNDDMTCRLDKVNIDLFAGQVSINSGALCFDWKKFGLSPIEIKSTDGVYFSVNGFQSNMVKNKLNQNVTYRGYKFSLSDLRLCIFKDSYVGLNYLKGDITVPFINQKAAITMNINADGVISGDVNASFIDNWVTLQTANEGNVEFKLKVVGMSYLSYNNMFCFNGYFRFFNQNTKGLQTEQLAISNVYIDSVGNLTIYGMDQNGWVPVNVAKTGKFNGFPITVSKFKIAQWANAYTFTVKGSIVLSDNLSDAGGSEFIAGINMTKGNNPGGMPPSDQVIQSEPTGVAFGNGQSDFAGQVKYFENDPVYGNGFMASMKVVLHNPGDFEAESKILIGKTNNGNGFSYWYLQAAATLPSPGISTGIMDIAVRSFEGRIYSHMKHAGTSINAQDYVPDNSVAFGIYGNLGVETSGNDGMTLWGKLGFEVILGPGFTSTLTGHVNLLSSGWGQEDGMVKGDAVITVSTNPKLFDANFWVDVNLKDAFCANGSMQMHIDESTWYLRVGTKEAPVTASLLCSASGYHSYFDIEQTYTQFGLGYGFDTGYQEWGAGVGAYGRAWGDISGDIKVQYSPLQFTGTASLTGVGEIGVFIDIKFYSGKLCLLSGAVTANLAVAFPNPVCFAGSIHAEACIDPCPIFSCDICFGATLKVRYKDGNFALSDNCND